MELLTQARYCNFRRASIHESVEDATQGNYQEPARAVEFEEEAGCQEREEQKRPLPEGCHGFEPGDSEQSELPQP